MELNGREELFKLYDKYNCYSLFANDIKNAPNFCISQMIKSDISNSDTDIATILALSRPLYLYAQKHNIELKGKAKKLSPYILDENYEMAVKKFKSIKRIKNMENWYKQLIINIRKTLKIGKK
jgi:hypothetical protein